MNSMPLRCWWSVFVLLWPFIMQLKAKNRANKNHKGVLQSISSISYTLSHYIKDLELTYLQLCSPSNVNIVLCCVVLCGVVWCGVCACSTCSWMSADHEITYDFACLYHWFNVCSHWCIQIYHLQMMIRTIYQQLRARLWYLHWRYHSLALSHWLPDCQPNELTVRHSVQLPAASYQRPKLIDLITQPQLESHISKQAGWLNTLENNMC